MMDCMAKSPKAPKASGGKPKGPTLFIRMTQAHENALAAFIAAQAVSPERPAVGLKALEEFLAKHGYWPPKS